MRVSLIGGGAQTNISFNSESADGAIGFGSAGKAIDKIVEEVEKYLSKTNQTFMTFYKKHFAQLVVFCALIFSSIGCSEGGKEHEEVVKQLVTDLCVQALMESDEEYEGSIENVECLAILEVEKDSSRKKAWRATAKVQDVDFSVCMVEIKYRYVDDQVLVEVDFESAVYLQ